MLDSRQSRLNRCDKARSETGWCDGSTAHHINNNKSFNQLLWMTDGAIKYKSTNIACDWDFNGGILEQWNWPLGYENVAPQFLGCIKNFLLAPLCRSIKLCANYRTYLPPVMAEESTDISHKRRNRLRFFICIPDGSWIWTEWWRAN